MRLVLASASPARLQTLRSAGLSPEVIVSGVDEEAITAPTVPALVSALARAKAAAVASQLSAGTGEGARDDGDDLLLIGCDSMLELDGQALGKPRDANDAAARWRSMRGRDGILHTGHHVILRRAGTVASRTAVASTTVSFAEIDDDEIEAYVGTGEPLVVAGAFTIDGLGGAFVTRLDGDPHNVVGISLPLLRTVLRELGIQWTDLWSTTAHEPGR